VAIKSKVVYVCVSERFCGLNLKLDVTSKKKIFPIFLQQSELVILHRLDIASDLDCANYQDRLEILIHLICEKWASN